MEPNKSNLDAAYRHDLMNRLERQYWREDVGYRYKTVCGEARDRILQLEAAMTTFCERVESGEVRSVKTYRQFNELLGRPTP